MAFLHPQENDRRTAMARLAHHPELAKGERILEVAGTRDDGNTAVATDRALYYRDGDRPDIWVRIGWEELEHARWRPAERTLVLTGLPGGRDSPITLCLKE